MENKTPQIAGKLTYTPPTLSALGSMKAFVLAGQPGSAGDGTEPSYNGNPAS